MIRWLKKLLNICTHDDYSRPYRNAEGEDVMECFACGHTHKVKYDRIARAA